MYVYMYMYKNYKDISGGNKFGLRVYKWSQGFLLKKIGFNYWRICDKYNIVID